MSASDSPQAIKKTVLDYWLEDHEADLKDEWESMGIVERYEEGGFTKFCKKQFEENAFDDICRDCGHVPASGACYSCKMD